jgi:hypothetical protein
VTDAQSRIRVALALLAEYAKAHEDGTLYLTGGGIRRLTFPVFPATQPRLAIAVGLEVPVEEIGKSHTMNIEVKGPATDPVVKPVAVSFTVSEDDGEGEAPRYVNFVSNMENVAFAVPGTYSFVVSVDGAMLGAVELRVRMTPTEDVSDSDKALVRLSDGYRTFVEGDSAAAEEIFRDVVERFPSNPVGHNNLGFVRLGRGDPRSALGEFVQAMKLGFWLQAITDANIGCALYALGAWEDALRLFQDCLRTQQPATRATLYGIGPEGLFWMSLNSAADFVALMSLNAGWAAYRAGDRAGAGHYLAAARLAELRELSKSAETAEPADTGPPPAFINSIQALASATGHQSEPMQDD